MAFYLRKSKSFFGGLLNLNFSKHGVGLSLGVPGARLTASVRSILPCSTSDVGHYATGRPSNHRATAGNGILRPVPQDRSWCPQSGLVSIDSHRSSATALAARPLVGFPLTTAVRA